MGEHKHRKRFGQNFLIDQNVLLSLVDLINPQAGDFFLEIGPGEGALTKHLLSPHSSICALEIDRDLVARLEKKNWDNFRVIETDVLAFDFSELKDNAPLRCIGNLPYNISTPFLFHCFDHMELWQDMYFMLQQEVVLRLAAEVGSKHYSRLSVMAQAMTDVTALFVVPPTAFNPPPKVESQIVRMVPRPAEDRNFCMEKLSSIAKTAFTHRRKTLRNNFKGILSNEDWEALNLDPSLRPQALTVKEFISIANYVA